MTNFTVDHNSPIPAYYQIALDLQQRISGGEWRAGNKLPSENDLVEQYRVSRMTFRKAIGELVKEGAVVRRKGVGTFLTHGYAVADQTPNPDNLDTSLSKIDKTVIRQQVWQELRKVAKPDARFHWDFEAFVPDFENSHQCVETIGEMDCYKHSNIVFIAPDNSLTEMRMQAIKDGKQILVATHNIERGFISLHAKDITTGSESFASTLDGMETFGKPISLAEIKALASIDLLITGTSLVTETGIRWGKGYGYFDLEWGIFRALGVVGEDTPIIIVGHDCQVVDTKLEPSEVDTSADWIVTPTRLIGVDPLHAKPPGVLWQYIPLALREQIPCLNTLHALCHPHGE